MQPHHHAAAQSGQSTTVILWVPLIVTCIIQLVFSARCVSICISFLGLPCCPTKRRRTHYINAISIERSMKEVPPSRYTEPPRRSIERSDVDTGSVSTYVEPSKLYAEPPRSFKQPSRNNTAPPRPQRRAPPQPLPRRAQSLPASERQALHRSERDGSDARRSESRGGSRRTQEHRQHLQRGSSERSSIWI